MKLKQLIIFIFFVTLTYSCVNLRGAFFKPSDFKYAYDGKYTGIDSLLFVNGYFLSEAIHSKDPYDRSETYSTIMFYRDGLVCSVPFNNIPRILGVLKGEDEYEPKMWGNYKIIKDTVLVQLISNWDISFGSGAGFVNFIINSKDKIELWNTNDSTSRLVYKFHPLENRIDSTNWLLKKKWFYKK